MDKYMANKEMTYLEKIQSMNVEEMSEFLYRHSCSTRDGKNYIKLGDPYTEIEDTKQGYRNFLNSKYEGK